MNKEILDEYLTNLDSFNKLNREQHSNLDEIWNKMSKIEQDWCWDKFMIKVNTSCSRAEF